MTKQTYKDFLESKKHTLGSFGFEPLYIPDMAFDFQREIITRAIRKGRMAIFADTGLGKTLMQISLIFRFMVIKMAKKRP